MKKLYALCSIIVVTLLSLTACQIGEAETTTITTAGPTTTITVTEPATTVIEPSWLIIDTYFDVDEEIVTIVGKEFAIALYIVKRFNMYRWDVTYDENVIVLLESTYKAYDRSFTGGEGKEWFIFKALNDGTTEITFTYIQSSSELTIEQKVFKIDIRIR